MREPRNPWCAGELSDLVVDSPRAAELRVDSRAWPSWTLTPRQLCDLELLISGAFSPLRGFMTRSEYESVCRSMRLPDGGLWPIPVVLTVTPDMAREVESNRILALRDAEGRPLAALYIEEMWQRNDDIYQEVMDRRTVPTDWGVDGREPAQMICLAGRVEAMEPPLHYDHVGLRLTPAQVRSQFAEEGWSRVMALITDRPMHRADVELTRRELQERNAHLLLLAVTDAPTPDNVERYARVRCLQTALAAYPPRTTRLVLLPLASQRLGPREALRHALIARNFGCSDVLLGCSIDDAGKRGHFTERQSRLDPSLVHELLADYESEAGIRIVPPNEMVYVSDENRYRREDEVPPDAGILRLSNDELQGHLAEGKRLPAWFTFPAVATELLRAHPPRSRQGFTVFFTGLSGAGKSTIANMLLVRLLELGRRPVSLLDGDIVRRHLTSELGFSRPHRDLNIQRIAFVASEITRCGGVALCAAIAPYNAARRRARRMIEAVGGFFLVHVATPLEVCEGRDVKGLYAKARTGAVTHFTGISDPYEAPTDADIEIDTTYTSAEEAARLTLSKLITLGYLTDGELSATIDAV